MNEQQMERNAGFDFLKYVCAFLIICIHTDFFGRETFVLATRVAVPIFFMITGFFYTSVCQRGRQVIQIKKIFYLTILANLLYLLWELFFAWATSGGTKDSLLSWIDKAVWFRFFFLNESPFRSHLWYLGALLYVLIIAWGLSKTRLRHKLYWLIPLLLGLNLVLGTYCIPVFDQVIPLEYSRNFLFVGLPCFLLGDYLHHQKKKPLFSRKILWLILTASLVFTLGEKYVLTREGIYQNQDFFIGTIISAWAVYSLVKNNPAFFEGRVVSKVAWMGRHLSTGIYILHPIIRTVTAAVVSVLGSMVPLVSNIFFYGMPIIMLCIDSCVVWCMQRLFTTIRPKVKGGKHGKLK